VNAVGERLEGKPHEPFDGGRRKRAGQGQWRASALPYPARTVLRGPGGVTPPGHSPHRRHRHAAATVGAVVHRTRHQTGPPRRSHCPPERHVGHSASPQPAADPGRAGTTGALCPARSGREVHPQLRRGVPLTGWGSAGDPVRAPKANACGERWIRTVRAECLDWLLMLGRNHLDQVLRVSVQHYNGSGPTAHSGCKRQIRRPGRPSPGRIMEARCIDATCSAVGFTRTGELHERLCAPFTPWTCGTGCWRWRARPASTS
jgi:hypothetical protein